MRKLLLKLKFYLRYIDTVNIFDELIKYAPSDLIKDFDSTKTLEQNLTYHPENYVYVHIKVVTNRLHNKYHNLNLTLAGFFHDLGKIDTTMFDEKRQTYTAHEHEKYSLEYIAKYSDFIIKLGGDLEIINYLVEKHMRVKNIDEMKKSKRVNFKKEKHYKLLEKFNTCDHGGVDILESETNSGGFDVITSTMLINNL